MTASDTQLDEAILAVAGPRQLKVAMVIAMAVDALIEEGHLPEEKRYSEESWNRIGCRIAALTETGRLFGYGNLENWRHSEVKLDR